MLPRPVEDSLRIQNAIRQGIISDDGFTENCKKLKIGAADKNTSVKQDKAMANAYGNKFIIPLDFEMLDSSAPYYQAGSKTDYVTKLHSMITTKLSNPQ